jgi:hypothetical protein
MVKLAALDMAASNSNIGLVPRLESFREWPDPIKFRHPAYGPDFGNEASHHWELDAKAACEIIVTNFAKDSTDA